ncbi:hypothetical protein ACNTMW_16420 [Planosporangium sp. 12N6]|uniref:hypothetical protein n=1 Tax=Planosporangium spinosum TaxID=3402278 RepID=UPI003CF19E6E
MAMPLRIRHPCPPSQLAREEQVKLDTRARMEIVMEQLRRQADAERGHIRRNER